VPWCRCSIARSASRCPVSCATAGSTGRSDEDIAARRSADAPFPTVKKLGLWKELSSDEEAAILGLPHTVAALQAGRYLVRDGDQPKSGCLLVSGFACDI
jgi:hypothetical protein